MLLERDDLTKQKLPRKHFLSPEPDHSLASGFWRLGFLFLFFFFPDGSLQKTQMSHPVRVRVSTRYRRGAPTKMDAKTEYLVPHLHPPP